MKDKKLIKEILGIDENLGSAEAKTLVFNKIYEDLSTYAKKSIESSISSGKSFSIKRFDTIKNSFIITEFIISNHEAFMFYRRAKDLKGDELKEYIYSDDFVSKKLDLLNAINLNVHEFKNSGYKTYNTIDFQYSIGAISIQPDHTFFNKKIALEKIKEFLLEKKICKIISEKYDIDDMLKNILINEEYSKLEYMIKFDELILLEVEGYNDIVEAITSQHIVKPIEFYSIINKIEDKVSLDHTLSLINKNKTQIDDFLLSENYQSPNLLYNAIYSMGVIEELIEKFGNKNIVEEITVDAMNVIYSNIRYMVDNKRDYALELQKLIKEILEVTKKPLMIIPVIEYLGRLTEYQGIQPHEAISIYRNYLTYVKYSNTVLNSLDELFPPSIKKSIRRLDFEYIDVSNVKHIIKSSGLEIDKSYEYKGYQLTPVYKKSDFLKIAETISSRFDPNYYIILSISKNGANVGILQVSIDESSCYVFSQIPLREHNQALKDLTDVDVFKKVLSI